MFTRQNFRDKDSLQKELNCNKNFKPYFKMML